MIGEKVFVPSAWLKGKIDAVSVHPDNSTLARVKDQWFFVTDLIFKKYA